MLFVFERERDSIPKLCVSTDENTVEFAIMHESYSINKAETEGLIKFLQLAVLNMEDD